MKTIKKMETKTKEEIYVINPEYFLKNDGNKIIFCNRGSMEVSTVESESFFTYIHPYNAQLLSFFNGKNTLGQAITKAAAHFELPYRDIANSVAELIENKKAKSIQYKWHWMYFPKNVLVNINNVNHYYTYELAEFLKYDDLKFDDYRLNSPLTANLLLTMKCYTNCVYCYANRGFKYKPMTKEQIMSIIHQAKDIGIMSLDVNGGEVLLHPDCMEIFKEMVSCGFHPLISTKVPVERDKIKELKDIGFSQIQLSLDSCNKNTLCGLLNVKVTYFQDIDRTLHDAEAVGMNIIIHCVLSKLNTSVNEISSLLSYLEQFTNIKQIRLSPAGFSLYKDNYASYSPSKNALNEIFSLIEKRYNKKTKKLIKTDKYPTKEDYRNETSFSNRAICSGNTRSFVILPDGRVSICEELYDHPQFIIGDLTKQTIMEMWNSPKAVSLFSLNQDLINKNSPCSRCESFTHCRTTKGVCWKEVLMAYGKENWDYPDPRCPQASLYCRKFYVE